MIATTADELLAIFRVDVDDPYEGVGTSSPDSENLWKDATIYRYMTTACDALARRTNGLVKVATLPYVAGAETVSLPRHILHVYSARLASNNRELQMRNINETPDVGFASDYGLTPSGFSPVFNSSGTPRVFIRDYDRSALRLVPTPAEADSVIIQCSMTVAVPLSAGARLPFLDIPDQELILMYMKYLAYRQQDADTLDLARSDGFKSEWDLKVALRDVEISNIRRRPGVVRAQY